jgi:hypothetical protein
MAISFTQYINITSVVGGTSPAQTRMFGGRFFDDNPLIPAQSLVTFTTLSDVGFYFGTSSTEYARASAYFSFITKNGLQPSSVDFARWVDVASPPTIYGAQITQSVAVYQVITNGSFTLNINPDSHTFTGLDFSAVLSLSDVAAVIQTAINAESGLQWTAATVTWNATRGSFDFVGGDAVNAVISVDEGVTGTPIAGTLGWLSGAILSNGSLVESVTQVLTNSYASNNNFGSFMFIPVLSDSQETEACAWTFSTNIRVMYFPRVTTVDDANDYATANSSYGGVGLTLSPLTTEFPEQIPMQIFAATDYTAKSSVQDYMYYQASNITPSVSDDTTKLQLDAISVNYYGVTQEAGQLLAFYQTGELFGPVTSPDAINVFANEIWLKDAMGVAIMNLFLGLPEVSANIQGQSQLRVSVQSVIDQAKNNGTISVGKDLTPAQIAYVTDISQDPTAWNQVQNDGYWLSIGIVSYTKTNGKLGYQGVYTLIYSKNDTVQSLKGVDNLV